MRNRFLNDIQCFAESNGIPLVQFKRGERKDDVANRLRTSFAKTEGVVFIGVAQERAWSFKAQKAVVPRACASTSAVCRSQSTTTTSTCRIDAGALAF